MRPIPQTFGIGTKRWQTNEGFITVFIPRSIDMNISLKDNFTVTDIVSTDKAAYIDLPPKKRTHFLRNIMKYNI